MNSHLRVLVLCFWLFFLAFRPILCCCVYNLDATVTPPSLARAANHLLSPERHTPSRHTTFVRLRRQHLRRKSRRDKPSRYDFFETLHLGYTTLRPSATPPLRPSGTPLPSGTTGLWARPIPPHQQPRKQYRTSFPKPPLRPSGTPLPSGTLGSGLDPSLPTNNLGSSIGQAFQSHLFGRHHSPRNHLVWPPGQPPPPTALLVSLSPHHLLQPRLYPTSFGRRQPRMRTRPGLLSGRALLLRYRHQTTFTSGGYIGQACHPHLRRLHRLSPPPVPPAAA
jgi:hypothetical protein